MLNIKNTIKALTDQQMKIIYNNMDSTDLNQTLNDLDVIGNLTLIKILLQGGN